MTSSNDWLAFLLRSETIQSRVRPIQVTVYRFPRDRSGGVGVEGGLGGGRVGGEEFVEEREGLLVLTTGRAQDAGENSKGVGACLGTGAEGYLP
jgi:hypothetical protein